MIIFSALNTNSTLGFTELRVIAIFACCCNFGHFNLILLRLYAFYYKDNNIYLGKKEEN